MPILSAERVEAVLRKGSSACLDAHVAPRFQVGQWVLARNIHPRGHTRIPRYVRGHHGVVHRDHGVFVFPDSHAASGDPCPQHVYSVRFEAGELWGEDAEPGAAVYVDLWDDYLEAAP